VVEDEPAVLLLARVGLGKVELLEQADPEKDQALEGYNTAVAKRGYTNRHGHVKQAHNEVIKYTDRMAAYPEFIIHFVMRRT